MSAADGARGALATMSLRILIVEDDFLTAAAFAAALNDAGHHVIAIADNARSALAKAESGQADLALVDITLRDGRTGLATARALHADRVDTVLISGEADLGAKADAVRALGYIAKPADANAVARWVGKLERRHAWTARHGRMRTARS
ncbi:response regulator [Dongia sedimenti]|uniref:Response regulator n=1 Tax=Dongia sedimenti TaxID=3064282 RepID=A0ABU0YNI6_9PROT|nr:response regulator [Rhodospirillaceae bacterium R-7]